MRLRKRLATLVLLATMVISFTMRKLIKYDQIG